MNRAHEIKPLPNGSGFAPHESTIVTRYDSPLQPSRNEIVGRAILPAAAFQAAPHRREVKA
jgi:hypothetical protein